MRTKSLLGVIGIAMASSVVLISGCGEDDELEDFTAISAKPAVTSVDADGDGADVGDYQTFETTVTKDGKPFGDLYGLKLAVAAPPVDGAPSADLGLFQNQLTFVLPDGQILIAGSQYYTLDGSIPQKSLEGGEYRAIIGGTGAYAGAKGVLHTTSKPDGRRVQEFDFDD
jgi:hypothetical protein